MKTLLVAFVLLVGTLSGAWAAPVQWTVGSGGNGHWYEAVLVTSGINWAGSDAAASLAGGYLATLTSAAENTFAAGLVSGIPAFWWNNSYPDCYCGPWFGGYQDLTAPDYSEPAGGWRWITGETWSYTNWAQGEPNNRWNQSQQDRTHFMIYNYDYQSGTWDDDDKTGVMNGYIVEWNSNPIPEPGSLAALLSSLGVLAIRVRRGRN